MTQRQSVNFTLFAMALDGALVGVALLLAERWRPWFNRFAWVAYQDVPQQVPPLLFWLFPVLWVGVLMLFSAYDLRRMMRMENALADLTLGGLLAGVALAGVLYLSYREISRLQFLLFGGMTYVLQLTWRVVWRWGVLRTQHLPGGRRRVLILGAGPLGGQVAAQIESEPLYGLEVVGFLDDAQESGGGAKILGPIAQAAAVVRAFQVDDVVIALPAGAYERINALVARLHELPVKVWLMLDYYHLALYRAEMADFADIPMLDLRAPALNEQQRLAKRAFDLLVSVLLLPFLLPVMALIAVLIRLDSPGPVLFRQMRVGENGRPFEMLKFRTMVDGAEAMLAQVAQYDAEGNLIHKRPDDPRVTRVGRVLRRLSLDELPQIFNVLKGEMSLVGPRPELPALVEQYQPWQHKRFAVPPGITGWWQVNGRSERMMHLHTEDDLYYVKNYSLLLDVYILYRTVWAVLSGKGAY
ncbi:MAG: sugar transferase [Anaerolineales bacterium]